MFLEIRPRRSGKTYDMKEAIKNTGSKNDLKIVWLFGYRSKNCFISAYGNELAGHNVVYVTSYEQMWEQIRITLVAQDLKQHIFLFVDEFMLNIEFMQNFGKIICKCPSLIMHGYFTSSWCVFSGLSGKYKESVFELLKQIHIENDGVVAIIEGKRKGDGEQYRCEFEVEKKDDMK